MKVLLINPPEMGLKNSFAVVGFGLPLGLLYIAAMLEKNKHEVRIFDAMTHEPELRIKNIDSKRVHIGASWQRIKKEIRKINPDIVGISNRFSYQIKNAVRTAEIAKEVNKKIITVVGGPHSSSNPEDFLKYKEIDYVVRGEGEKAFTELVDKLEKKCMVDNIDNLAYRKKGKNIINPIKLITNLDELPFPAYRLINMENYFKLVNEGMGRILIDAAPKREISMITSRGCPYNCIFCSIHRHMGRKWRAHSSDYVTRHITYLVKEYRIDHISFEDDNLILDTKRFEEILEGMERNNIKITWDTPNGIRADRVNENLLRKMKKTGCVLLKIGVESGDQKIIDTIVGKNLRLEAVVDAARLCHQIKIPLIAFFIIGFPGEEKGNIQNTLSFAYMLKKKYDVDSIMTIAMPLVGTKMYEICEQKKYLIKGSNPTVYTGTEYIIETKEFNISYLKRERNLFYKRIMFLQVYNMLTNPSKFLRYAKLIKTPKRGFYILKEIINYVKIK